MPSAARGAASTARTPRATRRISRPPRAMRGSRARPPAPLEAGVELTALLEHVGERAVVPLGLVDLGERARRLERGRRVDRRRREDADERRLGLLDVAAEAIELPHLGGEARANGAL